MIQNFYRMHTYSTPGPNRRETLAYHNALGVFFRQAEQPKDGPRRMGRTLLAADIDKIFPRSKKNRRPR